MVGGDLEVRRSEGQRSLKGGGLSARLGRRRGKERGAPEEGVQVGRLEKQSRELGTVW